MRRVDASKQALLVHELTEWIFNSAVIFEHLDSFHPWTNVKQYIVTWSSPTEPPLTRVEAVQQEQG